MIEVKDKLREIIHNAAVGVLGSAKAKACSEQITDAILHSGILEEGTENELVF